MYICKKCNQIFSIKQKEHGKAKTRQRSPEYFPCDGEIELIELLKGRGKKQRFKFYLILKVDEISFFLRTVWLNTIRLKENLNSMVQFITWM